MKKIKMLLYGQPGVGKSVFALKFNRPYFITTDGNYEWLEDFGAKNEDHIQVNSWKEAIEVFKDDKRFKNYDTIVVDLIEDLFKWCEYEYCKANKLEHVGDIGYGKGYDITRNEFFIELSKLISKDKNIILLSHETIYTTKDRRGVESTNYMPSNRIPEKVLNMIEGRMRFVLRAYFTSVIEEDKVKQLRKLSLVPKENEYGIIRGVDTSLIEHDINLDYKSFTDAIEQYKISIQNMTKSNIESKEVKEEVKEVKEEVKEVKEEVKEVKEEVKETKKLTQAEKLAALKAKIAAMKK